MRARIIFSLLNKGAILPFHHQGLLEQMINNLFAECAVFANTKPEYSFSTLKGQTKVFKNGLCFFSSRVTLVFSSANTTFAQSFFDAIFKSNSVQLGELHLIAKHIIKEQIPEFGSSNKFICISPIVIANAQMLSMSLSAKSYICPNQDYFSDLLYESTILRMQKNGNFDSNQLENFYKFQLIPDQQYLEKIKCEEKKFARIYSSCIEKKPIEFRGYSMPFTLHAHPLVLKFVFENGLGELCSKGFGMLDLANQSFTDRLEPVYPTIQNTNHKTDRMNVVDKNN